jgi:hypothetical protein
MKDMAEVSRFMRPTIGEQKAPDLIQGEEKCSK